MKNLIIISNDKINYEKNNISSDFNDTINIINTLKKKFNIYLVSLNSNKKQLFRTSSSKISKFDFKNSKKIDTKIFLVLMISITPRNLLNFFYLKFLIKKNIKGFVYLRSDGFKEYNIKFGIMGYIFYSLIFDIIKSRLKIISVKSKFTKINTNRQLIPSEITEKWLKGQKSNFNKDKLKILYFGRFKKEKGFFYLIYLIQKMNINYNFTLAGDKVTKKINLKNTNFIGKISSERDIIRLYDNNDIFVLPSYTEGCPKVMHESISRMKPMIIFDEISHIKNMYKGIFCCKRNIIDFQKKIKYISKNYKLIQQQMKKNKIFTKKEFQKNILKLVK